MQPYSVAFPSDDPAIILSINVSGTAVAGQNSQGNDDVVAPCSYKLQTSRLRAVSQQ